MIFSLLILLMMSSSLKGESKPCALRDLGNDRKVCVCNSTYCDSLERVKHVENGTYVAFVSSKHGLRFSKTIGNYSDRKQATENPWYLDILGLGDSATFSVDTSKSYQTIIGIGGAITDAVGINLHNLNRAARKHLLRSYFSPDGAEYSLLRVPIGGTDFSRRPYSYDDGPEDPDLHNFKLAPEDYKYKIPFIRQAMKMSQRSVKLVASSWSPPTWMKTNNDFSGYSALKQEHYGTYADYIIRFLDEYRKQNLTVWGLSTGNEPLMGYLLRVPWNSLGWSPGSLTSWTVHHLGPRLRNSPFHRTTLMGYEDNRHGLPFYWDRMLADDGDVSDYIDCLAVHWYTDFITFTSTLESLHDRFPDKCILYTEASEGFLPWQTAVDLGSWTRGENYIVDIIKNLNAWVTGWMDWNLALDLTGGPNWALNNVDSPVIVNAEAGEFYKQPMYYALAHVSKHVQRGAVRVETAPTADQGVHVVTAANPDGGIVIVLCNTILRPNLPSRGFGNVVAHIRRLLSSFNKGL